MITKEELAENNIYSWNDIKDNYKNPDLLLGNGFSIQFSSNFSYNSLFEVFLKNCPSKYQALFKEFGTSNFELILKYLTYAKRVNEILGLETKQIQETIEILRNGLIKTINEVHPRKNSVNFDKITHLAEIFKDFGNIYSTNYDLFLYHIVLATKDLNKIDKNVVVYQDYYWGKKNVPIGFREFMGYQDLNPYKSVYYLHGSLFLFEYGIFYSKLTHNENIFSEFLDAISEEIKNDRFPIFISEGNFDEKYKNIQSNQYLTFCLNKLEDSKSDLVIFGNSIFSLEDVDRHILNAIKNNKNKIVYCIYCHNKNIHEINKEKNTFSSLLNNTEIEIEYIDSSTIFN